MGLSSIIRFNIGLLTFAKFVEFLKSGTVNAWLLNVFSFFYQRENMLKLCLNFNESQPIHAYKRNGYKKKV